jgi:hypothetical protein
MWPDAETDPGGTHRQERVREEVTGLSLIETDPVVLAQGTADLIAVG